MDVPKNAADATATFQILSRVAHDLRNPLNSISMNAELVKLKLQRGADAAELISYMDRILDECRNCGTVLESSMQNTEKS